MVLFKGLYNPIHCLAEANDRLELVKLRVVARPGIYEPEARLLFIVPVVGNWAYLRHSLRKLTERGSTTSPGPVNLHSNAM